MTKFFVFILVSVSACTINYHTSTLCWEPYSFDKNLFVGNILFPKKVHNLPQISVYRRGIKIDTETDNASKKIQFTISEAKECERFYILITQHIDPLIKENTVKCLKINPTQPYQFYEITLFAKPGTGTGIGQLGTTGEIPGQNKNQVAHTESFGWLVRALKVGTNGVIPDESLIVIFNPDYIEKLDGGNDLELPKIVIKNSILELAGSEKDLALETNELIMDSLPLKTLHTKTTAVIKPDYKKKLIIAMSE